MNIWIDDDYDKNLSICPFIIIIKKIVSEMRTKNWINISDMIGGGGGVATKRKMLSRL